MLVSDRQLVSNSGPPGPQSIDNSSSASNFGDHAKTKALNAPAISKLSALNDPVTLIRLSFVNLVIICNQEACQTTAAFTKCE